MNKHIDASFLFITYNRSALLVQSFISIHQAVSKLALSVEFVLSDDASGIQHQAVFNSLNFDTLSIADVNRGLGANQNKGIVNCRGDLVFQIQDDWIFVGEPSDLTDAIQILQSDPEVGIIQFTEVSSDLPTEKRATPSGVEYEVFSNDGLPWIRDCSLRPYSDRPHVKKKSFSDDIGPYLEGVPMGVMENDFKRRVATQKRWRIARMDTRKIFIDFEEEHSMNPGISRRKAVIVLRKIPLFGKWIESAIREIWRRFDHLAALIAVRLCA